MQYTERAENSYTGATEGGKRNNDTKEEMNRLLLCYSFMTIVCVVIHSVSYFEWEKKGAPKIHSHGNLNIESHLNFNIYTDLIF